MREESFTRCVCPNKKCVRHLHVFGEAAVVHLKTVASKKMDNRGKLLMFVETHPNMLEMSAACSMLTPPERSSLEM